MLLAIDIGNTNIHMGLWQDSSWALSWRARTVPDKMPDEYAVLVRNFLSDADLGYRAISGVVIGSVVPALTPAFVELVETYMGHHPLVITNETPMGIKIAIDQPEQAGADRLVNAAAVVALYGAPAIVIDFGTATTFDVVSADGAYCGGAIAPGIGIAHDALVSRAARLHKVDLFPPPSPIGRNTIHAMQSGIFWGYVSLVEGLVARLKTALDEPEIKVIATGGLAPLFNQHTQVIDTIAPELTLDGLRIIYEMNRNR
ncbi:MAG: type III pantothenate kinase [Chloroflexi bacterium]|nr:type III pantothenate kinase [Chloroflexota bacterium]MDL1885317.1 type III pantothenate kinase [Anaerolineae bacterium CFX8]